MWVDVLSGIKGDGNIAICLEQTNIIIVASNMNGTNMVKAVFLFPFLKLQQK